MPRNEEDISDERAEKAGAPKDILIAVLDGLKGLPDNAGNSDVQAAPHPRACSRITA
jgi:hypothetical protein